MKKVIKKYALEIVLITMLSVVISSLAGVFKDELMPKERVAPTGVKTKIVEVERNEGFSKCLEFGIEGMVTTVVLTTETPPPFMMLGVFGKLNGSGQILLGQSKIGAKMLVAELVPIGQVQEFQINPGWALAGDTNFGSWDMLCSPSGCPLAIHVCKGKAWIGTVSGVSYKFDPAQGVCSTEQHDWGQMSFHCWIEDK